MSLKNRQGVLILLVLVVLINASPLILKVPGIDSGVFLYTARQILKGDVPYRDVWDHKAPGIYFINVVALLLSPHSRWGLWLLEVLSLSTAALLSFETFKRAFDELSAFWGTVIWLSGFILVYEKGNLTEEFALPFKFATLFVFLQILNGKKYVQYGYLMGLAAGLTFFLRQNLLGISITCAGYVCIDLLQKYQWQSLVKFLLSSMLGFISILLIFVGYFSFNKALDDFWDAAFHFNFVYINTLSINNRLAYALNGFTALLTFNIGVIPAAFLGWLAAIVSLYKKQYPQSHALLWVGITTLPLEIFLTSLSGKIYLHYYMAWLPVIGLLASFFIYYASEFVIKTLKPHHKKRFLARVRLLMLVPVIIIFNTWILYTPHSVYEQKTDELSRLVTASTHPDDKVLVWGHNPTINFLADRESPTRFIYQTPLFTTEYGSEKIFAEFYRDIITNPPALIVEDEAQEIPPLNSAGVKVWKNKEIPPSAQAFFEFVAENYVQTENKAVYRYVGK